MKSLKVILILSFIFSLINIRNASAQIDPPKKMEILFQSHTIDTTGHMNGGLFSPNATAKVTVLLMLQDTVNISKIHVKLGTTDGESNIFSKAFDWDNVGPFSDSTTYKRKGKVVYLGIGSYTGLNNYFAEAWLEDTSNNQTTAVKRKRTNP